MIGAEVVELVIISNDTLLFAGETALLGCVGYGLPSVLITWLRDGRSISNSSLVSISEEDVVQGDRMFKQSFLQICNIAMADAGVYTCIVSNSETSVNSSIFVSVIGEFFVFVIVFRTHFRPF